MPRPSLTAALARLAELRDLRQKLVITRLRLVAGADRDRAERLAEIEADRLAVEREIRRARSVVEFLRIGQPMRRAG